MHHGSVQDLIDAGILFCGTPDQVYDQIVDFTEYCGGMGNLLMMGHAGFLTHEDTVTISSCSPSSDAAAEGLQAAGAGSDRGGVTRRQAVLLRGARRAVLAVAARLPPQLSRH